MTGPWFRRTALPPARTRLLLLLVAAATWTLFCLDTPPAQGVGGPAAEAARTTGPGAVTTVAVPGHERVEAGPAEYTDRRPCERNPGHHHCGGPGHHGVLGQPAFDGADRDDSSPGHTAAATGPSPGPSREPGAARPPDLHQLQLLRV